MPQANLRLPNAKDFNLSKSARATISSLLSTLRTRAPFLSLSYNILPSLRIAASSLCVVRAVVEDGAHWAIERLKAVNVPKISTPSLKDVKGTPASHTRLPARKFSLICGPGCRLV